MLALCVLTLVLGAAPADSVPFVQLGVSGGYTHDLGPHTFVTSATPTSEMPYVSEGYEVGLDVGVHLVGPLRAGLFGSFSGYQTHPSDMTQPTFGGGYRSDTSEQLGAFAGLERRLGAFSLGTSLGLGFRFDSKGLDYAGPVGRLDLTALWAPLRAFAVGLYVRGTLTRNDLPTQPSGPATIGPAFYGYLGGGLRVTFGF